MARIRTIKPSFWSDARVVSLSRDARLLTIGLISFADDHGRFPASAQAILGYVFPYDDEMTPARFRKLFAEITKSGLVVSYEFENRCYAWFPRWKKHQRISHPADSTLPEPPQEALF